ncbi:MAG: hypothetical protein Q9213_003670 [Squamulea squamosa]
MRFFCYQLMYLFLSTLLAVSIGAAAAGRSSRPFSRSTTNSSLDLYANNNDLEVGAIDPAKIETRALYSETRLPETSFLQTAVDTMVRLALFGWENRMPAKRFVIDDPRYAQVQIVISPLDPQRGTITTACAILGFLDAMRKILYSPNVRMRECVFRVFYDRQPVGFIQIEPRTSQPGVSEASIGTQRDTIPATDANAAAANLLSPAWQDPHLEVAVTQGVISLNVYEVFFSVLAFIQSAAAIAARQPGNARVVDFTFHVDALHTTTPGYPMVLSAHNVGNPPRTAANPPYFEFKWLVKALGQLPQYMLDNRSFKDIHEMTLKVDGVAVAKAYMVRSGENSPVANS